MNLTIKTAHGFLSFQPDGRLEYRDVAGPWEHIDLEGFELPKPVQPTPAWPPGPHDSPVQPPDIATTDVEQVRARVRWALWLYDSEDDESYWMDAIVLKPEPGHTPGWTVDSYWREKIGNGDGVGRGYVWPAR